MFDAILIDKKDEGQTATLCQVDESALPKGNVLVDIAWTTLNYKDALAITGTAPVVRSYPMVPGIDFTGVVVESEHPEYSEGDRVVLNGWGVGEKHWGGLAARARVSGDWLVRLPDGISLRQAAAIGTAGYTAMLCIMALERLGITPAVGEVAVTGAAGGVGSVATSLLAAKGYGVAAVTGRTSEEDYLRSLGATSIVERAELTGKVRPLAKERWGAAIDVAGGAVLANLLSAMSYRGVVACCGLAAGMDLPATVAPFILRGVTLMGIDSVMCPKSDRVEAWDQLAEHLDLTHLDAIAQEIPLEGVLDVAPKILSGDVRGRVVVSVGSQL